jgi:hypothetical protein
MTANTGQTIDDAPSELAQAIMEFFPPEEWENAAQVARLESNWEWDALNDSTEGGKVPCGTAIGEHAGVEISAERSIGYFQINSCNYPEWNPCHFYNVRQNTGTAHALWEQRGWRPWYFSAQKLGLLE